MAVVIETTLGDITVDLYLEQRPITCLNFLKLCKMKYYNFNLFHTIRSGFIAQTGDPTGEGNGGESIWGILEGPEKRFFSGEKMPKIRHTDAGLLSMVCTGDMMVGSQFFFTLASDLDSLDSVHCVIGEITEGQDILRKLNDVICDETYRPYQDVRITHTVVLEDPFSDPPGLRAPSRSPSPSAERLRGGRIAPDEEIDETKGKSTAEIQEMIEEKEAKARATILEIVGDLPDADIAPPENVLFVCKLNPVTTDDDLEIIFSRFGKIVNCEVIRDKKTGDSLQYAFIEFANKKSCEDAYFKMDNVLIDDRRIHVDFSQSVSKIKWLGKGRGVKHINDDNDNAERKRSRSKDRSRSGKEGEKFSKQRNPDDRYREKYISSRRDDDRKKEKYHNRKYHNERESPSHSKSREENRHKSKERIREKRHVIKDANDSDQINQEREKSSDRNQYSKLNKHDNYKNNREYSSKCTSDTRSTYKSQSNNSFKKNQSKSYDNNRNTDRRSKYYDTDHKQTSKQSKLKQSHKSVSQMEKKSKKEDHEEPKTPSPVLEKNKKNRNKTVNKKIEKKKTIKRKRKSSTSSDSDTSDSTSSSDSSSSSEGKRNKRKRKKKYSSSSSSETSSSSSSSSSSSESSTSTSSSSDSDDKKRHRKSEKNKKI